MQMIDGLQVSDAVPMDDGSLVTTLVDQYGQTVGTVTRAPDGTASANVAAYDVGTDGEGFDWSGVLGKVTSFLDNVAKQAKATSDEAQRLSNAAKGAVTGARVGYTGPLDWKPYLIGAGIVAGAAVIIYGVSQSHGRRRRR